MANRLSQVVPTIANVTTAPKVILDPGPGGFDGGAVGADGVAEKDVNLAIALKLKELLSINGFTVLMTREDDRSIHDEELEDAATRQKKVSDMYNRMALMEENPDAIFISIHQNQFSDSSQWGAQIFYSQNLPESEELALLLQQNFHEILQPDNSRQCKPSGDELYLLYEAPVPAVLVECGFLSNPEEWQKLQTEEYQQQVAFVIFYSLAEFFKAPAASDYDATANLMAQVF